MPSFGLTIGTERSAALQQSIQDELTRRGFTQEPDQVMAEYITIMIINNKTAAQITSELEDLIGTEYDPSFTDWLFDEAAKSAPGTEVTTQPQAAAESTSEAGPSRDAPPHLPNDSARKPPNAPRNGIYQQAISQALPSTNSAQKRSASARSPSPSHPNKSRRTDVPTGPRAMLRDGSSNAVPHPNSRSLLDRVGPMRNGNPNFQRNDDIQARIDNIVNNSPDPNMMMAAAGFPGMPGMDINAMAAANMANPLLLQEMMMNQMALMAQMASSMGIINPNTGQFGPGLPMQGMPGDMGMMQAGMMQGQTNAVRGRGGIRGGRGVGRGRGGATGHSLSSNTSKPAESTPPAEVTPSVPVTVAAPTPVSHAAVPAQSAAALASGGSTVQRTLYVLPERPQSPTLCKFGLKCTNAHCRYSHPSPVATPESGVVLSNDPCEKGKDCKDKDCIKAHVSPAVLQPHAAEQPAPTPQPPVPHSSHHSSSIPCRFGAACTRPGCTFSHPPRHNQQSATPCRFGAACTRATCQFQHPEGRVLPTAFHRGLSTTGGLVNVQTPETGTMGAPSPHKSVNFKNSAAGVKEKLKELEEKKIEAEKKVKDAEAAAAASANGKKDGPTTVATAA
ncbi:hypothetical protein BDQ17DRAFT_1344035 [Cyathus striatus]|nr:hypothetical protein BDQ17DRAFT_1344035 [Cyathus striatus]